MTEIRDNNTDATTDGKKPYVQPKLVTHGKVEAITLQSQPPGTSHTVPV